MIIYFIIESNVNTFLTTKPLIGSPSANIINLISLQVNAKTRLSICLSIFKLSCLSWLIMAFILLLFESFHLTRLLVFIEKVKKFEQQRKNREFLYEEFSKKCLNSALIHSTSLLNFVHRIFILNHKMQYISTQR